MNVLRRVCLLGFGEVGGALSTGLAMRADVDLAAWDWQFDQPASTPSLQAARHVRVRQAESARQAAVGCELVISAVTAAQALPAARSVLPGLERGAWYLDLNSTSPGTKRTVAKAISAAGGRFVEAVVMSAIAPRGMASPLLAGGPHAAEFLPLGKTLGFSNLRLCSAELGRAAATKMCRSVVVKGVEALLAEALLAARHYGVEDDVLDSLQDLFPRPDWRSQARYMISRSVEHGVRRAEEMREAAQTVAEAGLQPLMSTACAQRQQWAAQYAAELEHAN
ncbi:MAG: DUF1932 domain-containing protein, partial [Lysobacterales bacterium]